MAKIDHNVDNAFFFVETAFFREVAYANTVTGRKFFAAYKKLAGGGLVEAK